VILPGPVAPVRAKPEPAEEAETVQSAVASGEVLATPRSQAWATSTEQTAEDELAATMGDAASDVASTAPAGASGSAGSSGLQQAGRAVRATACGDRCVDLGPAFPAASAPLAVPRVTRGMN
jgi:hypothetical protein